MELARDVRAPLCPLPADHAGRRRSCPSTSSTTELPAKPRRPAPGRAGDALPFHEPPRDARRPPSAARRSDDDQPPRLPPDLHPRGDPRSRDVLAPAVHECRVRPPYRGPGPQRGRRSRISDSRPPSGCPGVGRLASRRRPGRQDGPAPRARPATRRCATDPVTGWAAHAELLSIASHGALALFPGLRVGTVDLTRLANTGTRSSRRGSSTSARRWAGCYASSPRRTQPGRRLGQPPHRLARRRRHHPRGRPPPPTGEATHLMTAHRS